MVDKTEKAEISNVFLTVPRQGRVTWKVKDCLENVDVFSFLELYAKTAKFR